MTMTISAPPARGEPNPIQQWWVLTTRIVGPALRSGGVVTAALAPAVFTVGFYIPLNSVMSFFGHGMSSYAQFLMPLIVLQSLSFTAISAAFRSSTDMVAGINRRFGSMPLHPLVPLAARMSATAVRFALSFSAAIVCGTLIGFRFQRSAIYIVGFIGFAMLVALALSIAADVLGGVSSSPEATTQALTLPQLILGMLSTGFAPAQQFPSWIQWFVRNQPISQFVYGLRALAGDSSGNAGAVSWSVLGPPLAWAVALIVIFVPLAARLSARRR